MKILVEVHRDSVHYGQPYCKLKGRATPIDTVYIDRNGGKHGTCCGYFKGMFKGSPRESIFFHKLILTRTGRKRLEKWIEEQKNA